MKSEIGAGDTELLHAGVERGAVHAQAFGSAAMSSDAAFGFAQDAEDVLALDVG